MQEEINQLKRKIVEIEKQIASKKESDVYIQNSLIEKDLKQYTQSSIERTITMTIGSEGGSDSEQVLNYPNGFLVILKDNKRYKIPYYNI